jgi:hypothetical protein
MRGAISCGQGLDPLGDLGFRQQDGGQVSHGWAGRRGCRPAGARPPPAPGGPARPRRRAAARPMLASRVLAAMRRGLGAGLERHLQVMGAGRRVDDGDGEVALGAGRDVGVERPGDLRGHRLAGPVEDVDAQRRGLGGVVADVADLAGHRQHRAAALEGRLGLHLLDHQAQAVHRQSQARIGAGALGEQLHHLAAEHDGPGDHQHHRGGHGRPGDDRPQRALAALGRLRLRPAAGGGAGRRLPAR